VVSIVIDQLAAWEAAERWPLLPADGGFARLRREGTWVEELRFAHSVTDTAPGHSALYTGATPSQSGVYANEVPTPKGTVSLMTDPTTYQVTTHGRRDSASCSLARLKVPTVADVLREQKPSMKVVSVSLKDRGALFGGGRHPTASLWFEAADDGFVTSSALRTTYPEWALAATNQKAMDAIRSVRWEPLDLPWIRAHATTPDDQPGEGNVPGFGVVFPHDPARAQPPAMGVRLSPSADSALLSLGLRALDAEAGTGDMLLAISLSTHDYVSHVFGPQSWETWDEIRRLDASLATFLRELDRRFGPDGYAVVLSADHGSAPLPELPLSARPWCGGARDRWERPCEGGRLIPDDVAHEVEAAAKTVASEGPWVAGVAEPYVHLTAAGRAQQTKIDAIIRKTLLAHREVRAVFSRAELLALPGKDELERALLASVTPDAGDYYVLTKPGGFFDPQYALGSGASHGTPYLYDRTVPLLVRAPGRATAGQVIPGPLEFSLFARTLTGLFRVDPPAFARGTKAVIR